MNKPKKVRNPLRKRLFRELLHDFGKYVVIFTFIFATIAMVAGFLVSDISLKTAYDESFEEYNVEDGHFTLLTPAEDGFFDGMERYYKVKVYENFYADREAADGDAVRVYRLRKDVNRTALWEGDYPSDMGEIAIDRLYAENNGYSVGDTMIIEGRRFRVSGLVALTDYSALFKNNTDMMFDAKQFTVALLSDIDFDVIQPGEMKYCYSWTNDDRALSADECKQKAEDIMDWEERFSPTSSAAPTIRPFSLPAPTWAATRRSSPRCCMWSWRSWRSSSPSPPPTPSSRRQPSSARSAPRATAAANCCATTSRCLLSFP